MVESSCACVTKIASAVKGYHVYKGVWDPFVEDTFITKHEQGNAHDKYYAVSITDDLKTKTVVGHLLKEISKISCHFIFCGGTITGKVMAASRKTRAECGGLEIPCELTFSHDQKKVVDKLKLLLKSF